LELDNNKLRELPNKICKLKRLEELGLENCELVSLPEDFGNLKRLELLELSGNQLVSRRRMSCAGRWYCDGDVRSERYSNYGGILLALIFPIRIGTASEHDVPVDALA
jgi:hypothetical protein